MKNSTVRCWPAGISPGSTGEWARLPYCANTKNMDHLIHRTAKGLWTRSKGEVAVVEWRS